MADDPTRSDSVIGEGEGEAPGEATSPEAILEALSQQADESALFPGSAREEYFFAFDTLMDQALVGRAIRNLLPAKVVKVPNHRLVWPWYFPPSGSALPSLERTNREEDFVWGMLYDAQRRDFKPLEAQLKVPTRYHRRQIYTIDRGGRRFVAFTYVLTPRDAAPYKPSRQYRDRLVELAQTRKLPEEWLAYLRGLEVAAEE